MMPQYPKIEWSRLVLVQDQIPRQKLILWLALHYRLNTVDKILQWGKTIPTDCVLCKGRIMEILHHLFFRCPYSTSICTVLLKWLGYRRTIGGWDQEVWLTKRINSSRPQTGILGFCWATVVYQI